MGIPPRLIDLSVAPPTSSAPAGSPGGRVGTTAYMAPEQCAPGEAGELGRPREDVWGLGATLLPRARRRAALPAPAHARRRRPARGPLPAARGRAARLEAAGAAGAVGRDPVLPGEGPGQAADRRRAGDDAAAPGGGASREAGARPPRPARAMRAREFSRAPVFQGYATTPFHRISPTRRGPRGPARRRAVAHAAAADAVRGVRAVLGHVAVRDGCLRPRSGLDRQGARGERRRPATTDDGDNSGPWRRRRR